MDPRTTETKKHTFRESESRLAFSVRRNHTVRSEIADEESFIRMLCFERKRAERSRKPFLLMLLDVTKLLQTSEKRQIVEKIVVTLFSLTRETDIVGWFESDHILGVIFTEAGLLEQNQSQKTIITRVNVALQVSFDAQILNNIYVSFYVFPEQGKGGEDSQGPVPRELYPDLSQQTKSKRFSLFFKRVLDVVGSVLALIVLIPVFLAVAVAIRLSSKGPVLFRQQRVGHFGKTFTCLKFRSMHCGSVPDLHKDYTRRFISGKAEIEPTEVRDKPVYKITQDPRVTRVGKFLRQSSLDELPQFWNVLRGEMSLVGPRPPVPYEFRAYDIWHRRRVLEVMPGMTGLWQVTGRSKTKFDEMVRLDLRYARSWSLWLDIKILLQTPGAVFWGEGGY